jgi:hypothetical protein
MGWWKTRTDSEVGSVQWFMRVARVWMQTARETSLRIPSVPPSRLLGFLFTPHFLAHALYPGQEESL